MKIKCFYITFVITCIGLISSCGTNTDEEIANLVVYQRAFQASARLLTTMDGLMKDVLNLTR